MEPIFRISQYFDQTQSEVSSPRAPPRYKRKVKMRGVANLNLENISDGDFTHQNDILFRMDNSPKMITEEDILKGNLVCSIRRFFKISNYQNPFISELLFQNKFDNQLNLTNQFI